MSQSNADDSNFTLTLGVTNNATVEFKSNGMSTSSGHGITQNNIPAGQTESVAFFGQGTSGTWTGLVGNASWKATLPGNIEVNVTLSFDLPYSGDNSGSFSGDANFNEYFTIDPNINIPSGGDGISVSATIKPK